MTKSLIKPDDPKLREMLAYLGVPASADDVTISINDIIGVIVNATYRPEKPEPDEPIIPDVWTPASEPPDDIRDVRGLMSDGSTETVCCHFFDNAGHWLIKTPDGWTVITSDDPRQVIAWREKGLLPCPFCGSKKVTGPIGFDGYIACCNCEATGPWGDAQTARDAWNRRK